VTTSKRIIAIDGPAGAGKSTLAKMLAARVGVPYLNTGAMYRALALYALENGVAIEEAPLVAALGRCDLRLKQDGPTTHVFLGEREVTEKVKEPPIGPLASRVSVFPGVRAEMVGRQRALGEQWGGVIEGRDIATVVFPDADHKFFLTATVAERAHRRVLEHQAKGEAADPETVRRDVEERDARDAHRAEAPLRLAPGAVVVDSTGRSTSDVLALLLQYMDH
jgi:cytidylate kinase